MEDRRPTPEEMLERAAAEERETHRGRLKVFFGAAPGVGKTFAMLQDARARRAEGRDVVIGWVEPHGRRETEALTLGIERIPPRDVPHRGLTLQEFDLDAALARKPQLLVLDELAHTNAESSRHARRWQDVEELLDAGIDVSTTLNVQHLESLNDVVAQITGVKVRETVSDSLFDHADEIELVDLTSEDLLQRMKEGKVYVPQQADRAMRGFFRKGNLIALRELSLRRTAERVDALAHRYRREEGIVQPWPTRERILVAIGPAPQSVDLVRAAYRMAARLHAPWIALVVESAAYDRLPAVDHESVRSHLALAEQLGAEVMVIRGESVAEEILALARARSVTRILIGKPTHARWRDRLQGSLVDELVRGSGPIDVLVTRGDEAAGARERPMLSTRPAQRPHEWWLAAAAIGVATAINLGLHSYITLADITMIYLLAVVLVASRVTRAPALFASVLAVAALDFAFVEPRWTFAVRDLRHILTFAIMLVVGVIVSTLTVRIRAQASAARQRERRTASLLALSRELAVRQAARDIASAGAQQVEALLGIPTAVLLADANGEALESYAGAGTPQAANERELAVARWVLEHRRPAGRGTETLPAARFTFLPLIGSSRTVGVFGVDSGDRSEPLAPSEQQLLETIVTQVASSLERALLAAEAERSRVAAETESMRSALLAAVSHDLRTPLATLRGATEVLQDGTALDERARQELLETVHDEVQRLERLVVDLLELSRLESHQAAVRREWYPAEDWIRAAIGRSARQLKGRDVRLELPDQVIGASVDATLLEQVMINLLDNAAKYTPADSPIDVALRRFGGSLEVTVADRGPGIPPGEELRIFEKFHRAGSDRNVRGTGLGLAVCRAIVTAHGGLITAEPREGGGAVLRFTLPAEDAPPADTA